MLGVIYTVKEIAFVRLSLNSFLVAHGPFSYIDTPLTGRGAVIAPEFIVDRERIFLHPASVNHLTSSGLAQLFTQAQDNLEICQWIEPVIEEYEPVFSKFMQLINQQALYKAVPVVFAKSHCSSPHALAREVISNLIELPPALIPYGLLHGNRLMLGATPEMLFETDANGLIRSSALAGSRNVQASHELLCSEKEFLEQQLVVEDIIARLSRLGEPSVSERRVLTIPGMAHLQSDITCRCSRTPSAAELINILHPTAALGIAPLTEETRRYLADLDPSGLRFRFGAPFGIIDPTGRTVCLVAIRNVQAELGACGAELLIGSGAGLVKGSNLDQEWQEMALKRSTVRQMLFKHSQNTFLEHTQ